MKNTKHLPNLMAQLRRWMMSSLAIFGDSYGQPTSDMVGYLKGYTPIKDRKQIADNIRKKLNFWGYNLGYETTVFAQGGTDILWSYKYFLENHKQYDKIIFIITDPERITLSYTPDTTSIPNKYLKQHESNDCVRMTGLADIDRKYKITTHPELKATYKALRDYLLHISDEFPEHSMLASAGIIHSIKSIRPDVKFIKAFDMQYDAPELSIPVTLNLHTIFEYENCKMFNIPFWLPRSKYTNKYHENALDKHVCFTKELDSKVHPNYRRDELSKKQEQHIKEITSRVDTRVAHLTSHSHQILAGIIKPWLEDNNTWLDFNLESFKDVDPDVNKYYRHKEDLNKWIEEYGR